MNSCIKIASYNVHRCIGTDGRFDPDRIAAVISSLDADVIGIQEVDSSPAGCRVSSQLQYLAQASGLAPIAGPTICRPRSHYGNALLTRHQISAVRRVDLSVHKREPRGALDVDLEIHGTTVRFIVTHLGLSIRERNRQFRQLQGLLDVNGGEMQVVMGDFNEWYPFSRPIAWLNRHFGRPPVRLTFPSCFPLLPLDRIWVRPRAAVTEVKIHVTPMSRVASDHLPISAVLVVARP
ncbi:endonuclease/exonuclease/phosphatase family protein [Desulfoferrobacter suflitae]|uniref:endonuclease/exonuclease/phosphatase family protein n=1 Tax=Desulfoferrobacter suflitae TaxID=2865782 RepID=UPI0021647FEA|nr:endonuclease/exonuclease/phosphatase family protein [Desulfoferrobacter suflitae]MCK8601276.1 endonuclease/exonuclease/phosphatase family protein [Desulfoferrobacter suflitae]